MFQSFVFQNGKLLAQDIEFIEMTTLLMDPNILVWIDMDQPTAEESSKILEEIFKFHPLAVEDCIQVSNSPKVEDYEEYIFMVMHAVDFRANEAFRTTELNLFMGKNFLVTYHTAPMRGISTIKERVKKSAISVARGADRLAHSILDLIIENYQPVLDELNHEITQVEDSLFDTTSPEIINQITRIKKEVSYLRQIISPQRDVIFRMARGEFKIIRPHLLPYYRDLYDHLVRIAEISENYRDSLNGSLQVYLNFLQNDTNKVVKALTLMTAISLPVTIISGWYGMNFEGISEFRHPDAYKITIVITLAATLGTLYLFKSRKWF